MISMKMAVLFLIVYLCLTARAGDCYVFPACDPVEPDAGAVRAVKDAARQACGGEPLIKHVCSGPLSKMTFQIDCPPRQVYRNLELHDKGIWGYAGQEAMLVAPMSQYVRIKGEEETFSIDEDISLELAYELYSYVKGLISQDAWITVIRRESSLSAPASPGDNDYEVWVTRDFPNSHIYFLRHTCTAPGACRLTIIGESDFTP